MSENQIKTEKSIRDYLLGRVFDEKVLTGIEGRLFSDDDFCKQVELVEDELINNYVFEELSVAERRDFEGTLNNNPERRLKVQLEYSLKREARKSIVKRESNWLESIGAFFKQPLYAGSLGLIVLFGFLAAALIYRNDGGNLSELKSLYSSNRPLTSRLSGFEYAPYVAERGGATDSANKNKLRLIENKLLERVERTPDAKSLHQLGVFYLTQAKLKDSVRNLEKAVELEGDNSKIRNDLGTAYLEQAKKSINSGRLETLAKANEEFTQALEIDDDFIAALYNKSLALEELALFAQAENSWKKYLSLDSQSKWAEEARKHLDRLKNRERAFLSKEEALRNFMDSFRKGEESKALGIHNQTKGVFNGTALHQQLARSYLKARERDEVSTEKEILNAFKFIGRLEKEKHADFFYADLAEHYSKLGESHVSLSLKANQLLLDAHSLVMQGKYSDSIKLFEESRSAYTRTGNFIESRIADLWVAEMLPDIGKIDESQIRLEKLIAEADKKKYKVLLPTSYYWLGVGKFRKGQYSKAFIDNKNALKIARETGNLYEIAHTNESMAIGYNFLGEYQESLSYLQDIGDLRRITYFNPSQIWRNIFTTGQILEKLELGFTASDFANESLIFSREFISGTSAVDASIKESIKSLSQRGKYPEALALAEEVNKSALRKPESLENSVLLADSFLVRANVKRLLGRCRDALSDYRLALDHYQKVPQVLLNLFEVKKGRLICLREIAQREEFETELGQILELTERYRQNIREDNTRIAFFGSEREVFDIAVEAALRNKDSRKAFELQEVSKSRSLLDFVKSDKSIEDLEKSFSEISKPLDIEEIQTRMSSDIQILKFALIKGRLAIWILSKNEFIPIEKSVDSVQLKKKVEKFQKLVLKKAPKEELKAIGKELYKLLIPPSLKKGKTIGLVVDKYLHRIPFSSLIAPDGSYLIEEFGLFYSPSASVLVETSENAGDSADSSFESVLSIGNPKFDRGEHPGLADLPNAEIEAAAVAREYTNSKIFTGKRATLNNFVENIEDSSLIHFAGHFIANGRSYGNSKLVFADNNLRTFELTNKKLKKTKLVVLSACETAFDSINKSEGAVGIARAFLAMGAPLVIASSWKVDSEATKDLMVAFHKNRKKPGLSTIEALRVEQLEMLNKEETKAPYYWAAFSAIGGYTRY